MGTRFNGRLHPAGSSWASMHYEIKKLGKAASLLVGRGRAYGQPAGWLRLEDHCRLKKKRGGSCRLPAADNFQPLNNPNPDRVNGGCFHVVAVALVAQAFG